MSIVSPTFNSTAAAREALSYLPSFDTLDCTTVEPFFRIENKEPNALETTEASTRYNPGSSQVNRPKDMKDLGFLFQRVLLCY